MFEEHDLEDLINARIATAYIAPSCLSDEHRPPRELKVQLIKRPVISPAEDRLSPDRDARPIVREYGL